MDPIEKTRFQPAGAPVFLSGLTYLKSIRRKIHYTEKAFQSAKHRPMHGFAEINKKLKAAFVDRDWRNEEWKWPVANELDPLKDKEGLHLNFMIARVQRRRADDYKNI